MLLLGGLFLRLLAGWICAGRAVAVTITGVILVLLTLLGVALLRVALAGTITIWLLLLLGSLGPVLVATLISHHHSPFCYCHGEMPLGRNAWKDGIVPAPAGAASRWGIM